MSAPLKYILFLLLICIGFSCKEDVKKPIISQSELIGTWKIDEALRNERPTKSLEGGEFVFRDDSTMTSNLIQSGKITKFTLDDKLIKIEGNDLINELIIYYHNRDTLVLQSSVDVFEMVFLCVKDKS